MRTEQEMYDLIKQVAKSDERIRAAYIHGSRANPNAKKDIFSDYDVVFVVTEIDSFINSKDWINAFGDITFIFESLKNENKFFGKELNDLSRFYVWGLLLSDGNRIDLLAEIKEEAMKNKFTINKQTMVLLDKDNCLTKIPYDERCTIDKPTEDKYAACCAGFWWFLNDVAKAIARDQLPYAKEKYNAFIRLTLNRMIDWHIGIKTGFSVSLKDSGRYLKIHLSDDFYMLYTRTYSDSDYENFWNAIFSSCELFGKLSYDVSDSFWIYLQQAERG